MIVNRSFLKIHSVQKTCSNLILQGVLFTWFLHSEPQNLDDVCLLELALYSVVYYSLMVIAQPQEQCLNSASVCHFLTGTSGMLLNHVLPQFPHL